MKTSFERFVSVYVHFPWCLKKCPYCDFATQKIEKADIVQTQYTDAVIRELQWRKPMFENSKLVSIFLGGGTPSLWETEQVGRLLEAIRNAFDQHDGEVEITVECNPSSVTKNHFRKLHEVGINRVSIGVQSLNDEHLKYLGRLHDSKQAIEAIADALEEVPRVSADLMFGMPGHTQAQLLKDARQFLSLGLFHLSAYALTIEPNTQFGLLKKMGKLKTASEDTYASLYLSLERFLAEEGLEHYEVSNYAKPDEASKHNQHYWRGGAYLGLGAAAVGCLESEDFTARRWRNQTDPNKYMEAEFDTLEEFEEVLTPDDRIREALMLGLRTKEGVALKQVEQQVGKSPLLGREKVIEKLLSSGSLQQTKNKLSVPHPKWLHLDSIVTDLF